MTSLSKVLWDLVTIIHKLTNFHCRDSADATQMLNIPSLPPSWQDNDPTESVFPGGLDSVMSPGEELERAIELGKAGLVSEYMRIRNEPHQDTFINSRSVRLYIS